MRILVTGGVGFIGSALIRCLIGDTAIFVQTHRVHQAAWI